MGKSHTMILLFTKSLDVGYPSLLHIHICTNWGGSRSRGTSASPCTMPLTGYTLDTLLPHVFVLALIESQLWSSLVADHSSPISAAHEKRIDIVYLWISSFTTQITIFSSAHALQTVPFVTVSE